ncbi:hypothetical protein TcCL_Unassigned05085 [Trypanosoma cruzi]|nr:hypothetical protein TcCL_Unassigned05085 [Trypanosoma cruzi]
MQNGTTVLRSTNALQQSFSAVSSFAPAHHRTQPGSNRQRIHGSKDTSARGAAGRNNPSAHVPGTQNATPFADCTPPTSHRSTSRRQITNPRPSRKDRRSQNRARACVLSIHASPQRGRHGMCVYMCACQRL